MRACAQSEERGARVSSTGSTVAGDLRYPERVCGQVYLHNAMPVLFCKVQVAVVHRCAPQAAFRNALDLKCFFCAWCWRLVDVDVDRMARRVRFVVVGEIETAARGRIKGQACRHLPASAEHASVGATRRAARTWDRCSPPPAAPREDTARHALPPPVGVPNGPSVLSVVTSCRWLSILRTLPSQRSTAPAPQ